MKTHIVLQTKHQLPHSISKHVIFLKKTRNCMGPLNHENKLQVDETNKKTEKKLKIS